MESAIVATLDPGNYTAIMSGKWRHRLGLVEAYDLEPGSRFTVRQYQHPGICRNGK